MDRKTRELTEDELAAVSGGSGGGISGVVASAPFSIDIGTSENLVVKFVRSTQVSLGREVQ